MLSFIIDNDGTETTVDLPGLRKMCRNNGLVDWQTFDVSELVAWIEDCHPDVIITIIGEVD